MKKEIWFEEMSVVMLFMGRASAKLPVEEHFMEHNVFAYCF